MTKLYLMSQLNDIPGNPEIVITKSENGITKSIQDISTGVFEQSGEDIFTFSKEKKQEESGLEDCIILWI